MWVVVIPPVSVPPGELAELADALDLGSSAARRKGSSPLFPTNRARGPGLTNTSIFSVSYETLGGCRLHQNINKSSIWARSSVGRALALQA